MKKGAEQTGAEPVRVRTMVDPNGMKRLVEPKLVEGRGGDGGMTDYGGAEEAWSQGGADESTGRDGVQRLEVE